MVTLADRKYRLTNLMERSRRLWSRCHTGFLSLQRSVAYPSRLKAAHLGLVFMTTVIVVGFFSLLEVDPHHDGIMLKPTVDVLNGKVLFRDSFSQYGPLTILVQALPMKMFGGGLIVIRLLTAFFYGLIAVTQWLIYSRFLPSWANILSWALWLALGYFFIDHETLVLIPSATVFPVFSVLLSVYLLIRHLESRRVRYVVMCGVATACTFWFKINFGIIHFGSIALSVALLEFLGRGRNRLRVLCGFVAGCSLVHLCLVIWLLHHQAFQDFWIQSVEFGYLFATQNQFSTNEPLWIQVIGCLLQINSKHGFTSALWTFLPITSIVVCGRVIYAFVKQRSIESSEAVVLSASLISAGLWFTYFPVSSVYHMWLGSALSVGIFVYLLWGITQSASTRGRLALRVVCLVLVFYPDLSMRSTGCIRKLAALSTYEKIETPSFLRGIYLPRREAQVYAQIESMLNRYPEYDLINLTRDGLYSLYRENKHDLHKMYLNWGWINGTLYPEFLPKLREQIDAKTHIIVTNESSVIDGYVPVGDFLGMGKCVLKSNVILHIPGEPKDALVVGVGRASLVKGFPSGDKYPLIRIAAKSGPLTLNSFAVKIYTDGLDRRLGGYAFEYGVVATASNDERVRYLKEWFRIEDRFSSYENSPWYADPPIPRILNAASGLFLFDRYSFTATSLEGFANKPIAVVQKGEAVVRKDANLLNLMCSQEEAVEIVPFIRLPEDYIMKVRINFNRNQYYETMIYSTDGRSAGEG